MYKRFRSTVEKIIVKHGGLSLEDFYKTDNKVLKVEKEHYHDFTIEKNGDMLFIGYYREQNGDLISDPIFVFRMKDDKWYPIRLEQWIGDSVIGMFEDGEYQYYPRRLKDVKSFATDCAKEWKSYYLER